MDNLLVGKTAKKKYNQESIIILAITKDISPNDEKEYPALIYSNQSGELGICFLPEILLEPTTINPNGEVRRDESNI